MGLITKEVKMTWTNRNKVYYINKGYLYTKNGDIFIVKVEDLLKSSDLKVNVECDCPDCKNSYLPPMRYEKYIKYVHEDGKYYCENCAKKYKLKNNKSFEQWCIENNHQDILNRWDYELNDKKPSEITYGTHKKYYFKCPREIHDSELKDISYFTSGNTFSIKCKQCNSFTQWCIDNNKQDILERWDYELNDLKPDEISHGTTKMFYFKCPKGIHESELKSINSFIKGYNGSLDCKACNSFAQWGIDNIGENFLEKYWDYEKNTINPWEIDYGSGKNKIWIKCQDKDYHDSYPVKCRNFINGTRCPYCNSRKVHPLDSLGKLLEDKGLLHLWSSKNDKSPYEYSPNNDQEVWWKCSEGKHDDYSRNINGSNQCDFRCPNCLYSKGENKIDNILTQINIFHDCQYSFNNLRGANRKLLRFDTPIFWDKEKTKLKLVIEYDGESHFRPVCFGGISIERAIENFKRQVENDIKKNLYCAENNIQLIRIPYWEFNNIEEILKYYLIENSEFDY